MNFDTMNPGDIVQVEFLDHCENGTEPMACTVWGRLERIAWGYLQVRSWDAGDDGSSYNNTTFVIVRSAITDVKVLTVRQV